MFSFLTLCTLFYFKAAQAPDGIDPRGGFWDDFFLADFKVKFVDNSRHLINDVYYRINQNIDIDNLLDGLGLDLLQEESEKWIVNIIWETWTAGAVARFNLEKVRSPHFSRIFLSGLSFSFFLCFFCGHYAHLSHLLHLEIRAPSR